MKTPFVYLILAAACISRGDAVNSPSRYISLFSGSSALVLGTEDRRLGAGVSFGYGRPEPKFRFGTVLSQLCWEGYVDRTRSLGIDGHYSPDTYGYGVLALSRWRWPRDKEGRGVYADLGWGLQFANRKTHDLDSRINSTPALGFGGTFPLAEKKSELWLGLRYLHISNAGTVGHNRGQNEFFVTSAIRW